MRASRPTAIVGAAVLVLPLAAALAACSGSEEVTPPLATATPGVTSATAVPRVTPGPGVTLWRWFNVTVLIPDSSGIRAATDVIGADIRPPGGGPAVRLVRDTGRGAFDYSWVLVDAFTGEIVQESILPEDRARMDGVLATIAAVGPVDAAAASWPYNGEPQSDRARATFQGLSYLSPDPSTGLHVYAGIGDPGGGFLGLRNGRSTIVVGLNPATGELMIDVTHVTPEDYAVMQRWAATVKRCAVDITC